MAEYYRPRSGSSRRSHDMMLDIILRQGEAGAADALNRGDVLAGMFNTAGQAINSHLANKEKQKAVAGMARRDAAWVAYIESGEWKKDPQQALTNAVRVWGPKEGPTQFNALQATAKIGQGNPEEDRKGLGVIIKAASKGGDAARARLWPSLKVMGNKVFPEVQLPDEYDPAMWAEIESYAPALLGEKEATPEPFTLSPGQQRFGPDGKPIAAIPDAAPKPPNLQTVETAEGIRTFNPQTGEMGPVIGRGKPTQGREQRLVQVETVDENGKPVTRFVDPQAGGSYPKPTGAGKPATGQQRKALQFFNRGKEAQEIVTALEEGKEINPSRIKYTPGFANALLSNPDQAYLNAQRAFTEARLRKESGAAVPEYEYENDAKTYFAQPGDSAETIAQKRAGRNAILAGIAFESGDALKEFYGPEADGMVEEFKKASKSGPRRVTSKEERDALPSGTVYIGPDGKPRRKQ